MVKSWGPGVLCYLISMPLFAAQWEGRLDWSQRTELGTAVSGVVDAVMVAPGERVKKGKLLLKLEQSALRARLDKSRAEMKHRKLLREEASRELERSQELYARTLLADHDLNLAKIAYAEADAAYQASRADTREAEEELVQSQLKAPFDAMIIASHVRAAETVISRCQAPTLLTLAAAGQMEALIAVGGDDLSGLKIGQAATVDVSGKRYEGKIVSIGYEPENRDNNPRYPVTVRFPTKTFLRAGQPAMVNIQ